MAMGEKGRQMIYLQSVINGIGIGSSYALVGLAALFVLRVTGVMNFAVGGIVVLGGLLATSLTAVPAPLLVLLMVLVGAPAGVAAHYASTRWMRQSSELSAVLITVALATGLQGIAFLIYGSDLRYSNELVRLRGFRIGASLTVDSGTLVLVAAVALGYVACWILLDHSHLGRALRAVSDDRDAARLVGLSVTLVELAAYAILGSLAFFVGDVSSQVVGISAEGVFPVLVGALFGLVIGGDGKVVGPLVGGMLVGVVQSVANATMSQFWGTVVVLLLVLTTLSVAPKGMFPDRRMRSVG
jgi:branched-chain amino acid transport system permease protein